MAASTSYADGLKLAVILAIFYFLTFPPPKSAQGMVLSSKSENFQQQKKNTVLGSKPPGCVNKCFSCRPCMATLVVPSHQKKGLNFKVWSHGDDNDGSYYLLSWKCRCGDKIYQP